ncbi:hypothetical protein PAL_GLEAN10023700 [Pteropus alecto]|uniref:Uncharacterized protein n=1 Tax=Pteropus alecto TaxID=9402 RepID=L5K5Q7_PTEAL|nr:hypothetical protein PAL_GLEAN10023700 [Pteropus alecto]
MTGVRGQSSDRGQFESQSLSGYMAGLKAQRMEARLEQRRSRNGDIDEEAVGIIQFRLKLRTIDLL